MIKNSKKYNKLNIISIIDIVLLIILMILILNINILPIHYLILILFTLSIISIVGIILINIRKKILRVLGTIILIIMSIINGIGSYYLFHMNNFLNNSFSQTKETSEIYYIVTSKQNKKNQIKGEVYYYKNSPNINEALKLVKAEKKVKIVAYDNILNMIHDVSNENIDFILIDKISYSAILNLTKEINQQKLRVVSKFNIKNTTKNSKKVKTKFNIYIKGTDTEGLNDYNAIVTINNNTHEVLLTSIPRDYYMEIAGQDGKKDSLSHMFIYHEETSKKSLENFFNIKLDYNIDITPDSLVSLVDKLGGITYCSNQRFRIHIPVLNTLNNTKKGWYHIEKGCQNLDGLETYGVAHERNSFIGRDRMRQKNCQKIMIAIFDKMMSTNSLVNYKEILDSLSDLYTTDIPKEVITNLVKDTIDGADWKIMTQSVDGSDKWDADIAILNDKGYAMIPNENDVINATNKINEVLEKSKR